MASRKFKVARMGEDIISKLPDDALTNIISRLEAKDAVKTSVLSSRWKHLWTSIYNLRFEMHPSGHRPWNPTGSEVMDFAEHVLHHCQSKTIREFHLNAYATYLQDSDVARVGELLRSIIVRSVHTLTLKFRLSAYSQMVKLPPAIVTSKSLVKLTLAYWNPDIDIPESGVCFPNLKFLSICLQCAGLKFRQKLFRSCPVLEELALKEWFIERYLDKNDASLTFDITVPTLKKLKLDIDNRCSVIRARNLEYLHVSNYFFTIEEDTPFLDKLILKFGRWRTGLFHEGDIRAKDLSRAIRSTRGLFLSSSILEGLHEFPSLHKLAHLYLEFNVYTSWSMVLQFLNNVPNLEVLVLQHIPVVGVSEKYFTYEHYTFKPVDWVPSCMLSHLKKVYFSSFVESLITLVSYLLQNSKVLERFFICTGEYGFLDCEDKILNLPRASSTCEIEFVKFDYFGYEDFSC